MLTLTNAVISGVVQGLSEFLPISSSAHIVFTASILKILTGADYSIVNAEDTFFDILLHFGTLVSVLIYFRKMLWEIIVEFFKAINKRDFSNEY